MAIINEKSNMTAVLNEDTRFTSKADISIGKKDDSLAAVIVSANESSIALIMDSNITVSTPIQDAGGQTDYTAAINTSGDYSTMLISNNVAKTINDPTR